MAIQANVSEGSVREKKTTRVDYDVTHPEFHVDLERPAVYSFVVTGGIHTDRFSLHRNGTGQEIVDTDMNVSYETPGFVERLKLALAVLFPSFGEKYGAVLTKYGLKDSDIQDLQPNVDVYNTQCGVGIQAEYLHPVKKEVREIPTGECLVDKL